MKRLLMPARAAPKENPRTRDPAFWGGERAEGRRVNVQWALRSLRRGNMKSPAPDLGRSWAARTRPSRNRGDENRSAPAPRGTGDLRPRAGLLAQDRGRGQRA